ncbi:MAG: flagellar basal-body rod protein FlgG [Deltaproteobacteria bacterium]|nr:MAG: flagellar basal-body rod protein FlgG [Deltaproteobacteria bacterium]RLA87087.1 MAG: flagellar basal-body rod protein FlgG [Deltaproteobacteria bacterium]
MQALWIAATGMKGQELRINVIAHNLANVNTSGFKVSRIDFEDLLYQSLKAAGATSAAGYQVPTGMDVGLGVRPAAIQKIFLQGDYHQTQNPLDLAIEGKGFFKVTMPDGQIAYTRSGSFKLDSEGRIVTSEGYPLDPEIVIPAQAITVTVDPDGTINVTLPGQIQPSQVGRIELADFVNPAGLKAIGKNLFLPTAASGDPTTGNPGEDGMGTIAQGFLEMSNVDMVTELVEMIMAQRAYEINGKVIQSADDMLQIVSNLKR